MRGARRGFSRPPQRSNAGCSPVLLWGIMVIVGGGILAVRWIGDHPLAGMGLILATCVGITIIIWIKAKLYGYAKRVSSMPGVRYSDSYSGRMGRSLPLSRPMPRMRPRGYAESESLRQAIRETHGEETAGAGRTAEGPAAESPRDVGHIPNSASIAKAPDSIIDILISKGLTYDEARAILKTSPWMASASPDLIRNSILGTSKPKKE